MKRYYKYFRIEKDNNDFSKGMLFTEKELKRELKYTFGRFPEVKKVKVSNKDIYFCFGARFAENYIYL